MVEFVCECWVDLPFYAPESQLQKEDKLFCETQTLSTIVLVTTATACFIK